METIGIIGASGQVGTEVCLLLQCLGAHPVALCRSELAAAFLRRCGVECRVGGFRNPEEVTGMLAGCGVVADFSLIRGAASEMRSTIARLVGLVARHAPSGARYVYISSEMAYGMRQQSMRFESRLISRTLYGASKRYGERLAFRMGRAAAREVFALRLGQVHGELQNESARILAEIRPGPAVVPDAPSDAVFTFTVAEALLSIARGQETPGLYTLVAKPQWSWKEVYEFHAARAGIEAQAIAVQLDQYAPPPPPVFARLRSFALAQATQFRESLSAYLLWRRPDWERRLAATYRRQNAARDIARMNAAPYRPCDARLGEVLGQRLRGLSDSRSTMAGPLAQLRDVLEKAAPHSVQGSAADILKGKR